MFDRVHGEVHIEIRPVKVVPMGPSDIQNLPDGSLAEPWEPLERHEQLPVIHEEPETIR
jgi:hypothetical protein